jgi:hypothetical protein
MAYFVLWGGLARPCTFLSYKLVTMGKGAKTFQQKWCSLCGLKVTAREASSGRVNTIECRFSRSFGSSLGPKAASDREHQSALKGVAVRPREGARAGAALYQV